MRVTSSDHVRGCARLCEYAVVGCSCCHSPCVCHNVVAPFPFRLGIYDTPVTEPVSPAIPSHKGGYVHLITAAARLSDGGMLELVSPIVCIRASAVSLRRSWRCAELNMLPRSARPACPGKLLGFTNGRLPAGSQQLTSQREGFDHLRTRARLPGRMGTSSGVDGTATCLPTTAFHIGLDTSAKPSVLLDHVVQSCVAVKL